MKTMYIYIMTNHKHGTLYIGVTNDLVRRVWEHKNKVHKKSFTARYNLTQLVYYEIWQGEIEAIAREKSLKRYNRVWKIELVDAFNPTWHDMYEDIL